MVRFTNPRSIPPLEDVEIPLLCGPAEGDEWPPELMAEMEAGWRAYGAKLMQGQRVHRPGERIWGYWVFELGIDRPETRLERVLELQRRGLLTDDERGRLIAEAEHARKSSREPHVVTSPASARAMYERQQREHKAEAAAILAALTGEPECGSGRS